MKDDKSISEEAKSEGESMQEEKGEYQHIDEFVKSLDPQELAYLKGCLKNHKADDSSGDDSEGESDSSDSNDKELSSNDYED